MHPLVEGEEEFLTWGDTIAVERRLFGQLDAFLHGLFTGLLIIKSCPEPSGSLLVHLGARRNAIDGHVEKLLRLDLSKQMLDVVEYANEHLLLAQTKADVFARIFVGTVMDDAIHVKLRGAQVSIWVAVKERC
jgi:hypothetical protein